MSNTARIETNNCIVWTRVSTKYQEENRGALFGVVAGVAIGEAVWHEQVYGVVGAEAGPKL